MTMDDVRRVDVHYAAQKALKGGPLSSAEELALKAAVARRCLEERRAAA